PSPAMSATRHAETSDPSGDALADPSVSVSPDLVRGTADVVDGVATFQIFLAPGTLDAGNQRFPIDLDLDQNLSTGSSGVDYYVFVFPAGGRGADVARVVGDTYAV